MLPKKRMREKDGLSHSKSKGLQWTATLFHWYPADIKANREKDDLLPIE